MYIETKTYKVKFKNHPVIYLMPGMWVNAYYDTSLSSQIEYVKDVKED